MKMKRLVQMTLAAVAAVVLGSCGGSSDPPALLSIEVLPKYPDGLPIGYPQQLTAIGTFDGGATDDITDLSAWVSSNAVAVAVEGNGLINGVSAGMATITASRDGVDGTLDVSAFVGMQTQLVIDPAVVDGRQQVGVLIPFTATGTFTGGVNDMDLDITGNVDWITSNSSVVHFRSSDPAGTARTRAAGLAVVAASDPVSTLTSNQVSIEVVDR